MSVVQTSGDRTESVVQMSGVKTEIAYPTLIDTGVSLRIRLIMDPVTPQDAEAFLGFLNRYLEAHFAAWEEAIAPLGIIPIIEVRSGSIEAIIRFMQEKTKDGKEFARDVAKDIAKDIAKTLFWAFVAFPAPDPPPPPPPNLPPVVEQHARDPLEIMKLFDALEESGKPFTVEIFDAKVVMRGNQPKRSG